MATPAFLRYLPARLKPLSSPLVWAPLVALGLLGIFVWEYRRDPDWANRQPTPETDAVSAEFTPEEQAKLSEIDTLDVLLQGAEASGGGTVIGPDATLPETPTADDSRQLSGRSDPFGIYTDQYKFPGTSAVTTNGSTRLATPSANALPSSPSGLNGGVLTTPPATATGSALSDALDRQRSAQPEPSANSSSTGNGAISRTQPGSAVIGNQQEARPTSGIGNLGANSSGAGGTGAGSISVPYTRTTTDMSPPAGTTGYRPPATSSLPVFNQAPTQPSRNPYSTGPAPASSPPASLPGTAAQPGVSYTPPSFTQPNQTRQVR